MQGATKVGENLLGKKAFLRRFTFRGKGGKKA